MMRPSVQRRAWRRWLDWCAVVGRSGVGLASGAADDTAGRNSQRLSGALIGIAGAVGAFGGVLVNVVFRSSFLNTGNGNSAYIAFIAFYAACVAVTWFVYLRPAAKAKLPGV